MLIWRYASDASSRKLEGLKCWHMVEKGEEKWNEESAGSRDVGKQVIGWWGK